MRRSGRGFFGIDSIEGMDLAITVQIRSERNTGTTSHERVLNAVGLMYGRQREGVTISVACVQADNRLGKS